MLKRLSIVVLALLCVLTVLNGCGQKQPDETQDTESETIGTVESDESVESVQETEDVPENDPAVYSHVAIIGVDGAGAFFRDADMPELDEIMTDGAVTYSMLTSNPTISAQCWGSMLCGVIPEVHHFTNSKIESEEHPLDSAVPSVFRVIREQMPDAVLASFCNWEPINNGIIEEGLDVYKESTPDDERVSRMAADYVKENQPTLLFVQFDQVDGAGHTYGYGTEEHLKQLSATDKAIARIYTAYERAGILDDTLFIVTADHGGQGQGHGGWTNEEKYVMFAAKGKTVVKGGAITDMAVRDTAAIVLHALGLDDAMPEIWTARVPSDLFDGVVASERKEDIYVYDVAYRTHTMEATPEIGSGSSVIDVLGADRLLAYFPFDGNGADALGNWQTEEFGKLYFPEAFFGNGAQFDDGYIRVTGFEPETNSFSISFWMNTPGTSGDPAILGNKGWASGANPGYVLVLNGSNIKFNVGDRKNRMDPESELPGDFFGGWTYVTVIVDREKARIGYSFDFGEIEYHLIPEEFLTYSFSNMKNTNIGQDGTGHYNIRVPGTFDEMIFVDGVLTNDDIAALKNVYIH